MESPKSNSSSFHSADSLPKRISRVKNVILILSGKGGTGKSTVSAKLSLFLSENLNKNVCLLDIDLTGPTIAHMFNLEKGDSTTQNARISESDLKPCVINEHLSVFSIGSMIDKSTSVVLRGPAKTKLVEKFMHECFVQNVDYLIIDTPPGTSDEHIAVIESLKDYNPDGAILVTTPQRAAVQDVQREVNFCKLSGINIIGVIENMSYLMCPSCDIKHDIFSSGGGKALADKYGLKLIAQLPLIPQESENHQGNKSDREDRKIFEREILNICLEIQKDI